jgi:acyl CoA:acetate/3-ketoacid CoA transferase beta subunit
VALKGVMILQAMEIEGFGNIARKCVFLRVMKVVVFGASEDCVIFASNNECILFVISEMVVFEVLEDCV